MNASAEEFGLEYIIKSKRLLTKSWMLWQKAQPHKTEGDGRVVQLLVILPNYSR